MNSGIAPPVAPKESGKICGMPKPARLFIIILAIASLALHAAGQSSVTLAWDANPEPDIAGYKIYIGTASGVYPVVQDVGQVTMQVVPGLSPSTTYHFSVQAYNTAGLSSILSNEVVFTTMPGGEYGAWAAAGSLSGLNAAAGATPYNDGVPNILKYAFNMNPSGPDGRVLQPGTGTAGLPFTSVDQGPTGSVFNVEFIRRTSGDLTYAPMISTDLVSYQPMTGETTIVAINADWERVVIRKTFDAASLPKLFATVKVTLP
jgi:hypothetical protein